jgi:hypothetical protein
VTSLYLLSHRTAILVVPQMPHLEKRLAKRERELFLDDLSMAETVISRTCQEAARFTYLFMSRVPSSASEICISLVSPTRSILGHNTNLHTEGDGEISFCGAIEMPGVITIKFTVMKGGVAELAMKSPIYIPGPCEPQFGPGRYIYFEGFSVDEHGKQHYMDTSVAYRQTSLRAIEYLRRYGKRLHEVLLLSELIKELGYDDYQSYLLLGCAPVQGHVAGIVDVSLQHLVPLC